jgi:hypothetical protein
VNATGSDIALTYSPLSLVLIKPQGRTVHPERSKLVKSHGSNQWLTSKIQLIAVHKDEAAWVCV